MNHDQLRPLLAKEIELINRGGIAIKVVKLEPMKPIKLEQRDDLDGAARFNSGKRREVT